MRAVNLLPREAVKQRKPLLAPQNAPALVGAGLGIVVTGALAIGFLHESGAVSSAQSRLQEVQAQLAATPKPAQPSAQPVDPNAALAGQQSARMTAVTNALGARVAWDRILREVSQVLPDDVWLSTLSLQAPGASGATPTAGLTIGGTTYSHDSVARLLGRLALIPELSNVTLGSDSASGQPAGGAGTSSGGGAVTFTISATINSPAGATSLTAPPPAPPPPPTDTSTNAGASS